MRHVSALQLGLEAGQRIVSGEEFEMDFTEGIARYFGADAGTGLTRFRPSAVPGSSDAISVTVSGCPPLSPSYLRAARDVVPRHPGFPAMLRAGTRQPIRLSDVVRLPAFWETDVFARMHGHMPGTRYPMSALLSLSRTEMIFIGLHRATRDFSDEDVSDLAAVQKVVAAAWRYRTVRSVALAHLTAPAVDGADPAPDEVTSSTRVTDREAQVLDLLVRGWGNAQIGASLGITERTVRKHLSSVFRKGDVSTRAGASAWWQAERDRGRFLS